MADPWQGWQPDFDQQDLEAQLPSEFCEVALQLRDALDEGRMADAKRIAIKHLREGLRSQQFADVIAEMLGAERRSGTKGRKPRRNPPNWLEIGHDFWQLQKSGRTYEEASAQLAKKYRRSERTIKSTWAFFKKSGLGFFAAFGRSIR